MTNFFWLQLSIFFLILLLAAQYVGSLIYKALTPNERPFLAIIISPLEQITYKILRINPEKNHSWKEYLFSFLTLTACSILLVMAILLLQGYLPFNPENLKSVPLSLAFSIAVSFATTTDWQCYSCETTLSHLSQMAALSVQNFISPALALACATTLVRAFILQQSETLGNFWVDIIRIIYYVLLPLSILFATLFIMEGTPQNFDSYTRALTLEGEGQVIVQGPIASQEAIKLLGSNGGGFTTANSSHPYENPTPLSNALQMFVMLLLPVSQLFYFARCIANKKHIWSIIFAIITLFVLSVFFITQQESMQNPFLSLLKITPDYGNMEGKEVRFSLLGSTLYSAISTASSNGSTSSIISSYLPLGGMGCLVNILMGQTLFGGLGSGLHSVIIVVIISQYLSSLISGKSLEYLKKKLDVFDIKMIIIANFAYIAVILAFTSFAIAFPWGREAILTPGPHGFTEIVYLFSSVADSNGSSLIGPSTNTDTYHMMISLTILISRLGILSVILALSGSIARKKLLQTTQATIPIHGMTFCIVLIVIMMILGAMSFLPALFIGPILENLMMYQGSLF